MTVRECNELLISEWLAEMKAAGFTGKYIATAPDGTLHGGELKKVEAVDVLTKDGNIHTVERMYSEESADEAFAEYNKVQAYMAEYQRKKG